MFLQTEPHNFCNENTSDFYSIFLEKLHYYFKKIYAIISNESQRTISNIIFDKKITA